MKIPTWMVVHLQEAADPGVLAFAKWLRGEVLAVEEAHLLFMRGWISVNDMLRNAGLLDAFAQGGEIKPGEWAYVVGMSGTQCIGWVPPAPMPWTREYIETLNKKLAGKKIRRVERTRAGDLNFITDDAEGDAVDNTIIQHHCGGEDKDYEHWSPMKPGDRCSYCGWEYSLRVDVTTHSDDHRMWLNLSTGLVEKGEPFAPPPPKRWEVSRRGVVWTPAVSLSGGPTHPWDPDIWRMATLRDGRTIPVRFWREVQ
jgi:hypothetical protein